MAKQPERKVNNRAWADRPITEHNHVSSACKGKRERLYLAWDDGWTLGASGARRTARKLHITLTKIKTIVPFYIKLARIGSAVQELLHTYRGRETPTPNIRYVQLPHANVLTDKNLV
jgi:hypothetical protein